MKSVKLSKGQIRDLRKMHPNDYEGPCLVMSENGSRRFNSKSESDSTKGYLVSEYKLEVRLVW